jgi:hypothetical protein
MYFWFIPKMVATASSSTSALVAAGSLRPSGWWAGLVGSHALCAICCTLSGSTGPGTYSGSSINEYGLLLKVESLMHDWDPSSFCYKQAQTFLWWQVLLHLPQNSPSWFVCRVENPDVSPTTTQHSRRKQVQE